MSKQAKTAVTVAEYIRLQIDASKKSQRDIALECGFDSPNIIAMIKNGSTKIPLNRIGVLAKSLGVDPAHLTRMAMSEYMPETWCCIESAVGDFITAHEKILVDQFRQRTSHFDPAVQEMKWVDGQLTIKVDM